MSQSARHTVIDEWTGRHACALQAALRMSQDEMAALIGVAKRTIAAWHERPEVRIRPELQRALDTAYERSDDSVKIRFARSSTPRTAPMLRRPEAQHRSQSR